ncbi:MAG: amino acid adenylation domain-containing protein [Candidatus Omnitrophota bacterium]
MEDTLHALLERSAGSFPDKTAVRHKDRSISYGDINELSGRWAACFAGSGVSSGARVGIYMDKSIEAVAAVFAVLKTGACYVPLDPFSPPDRLKLIINDCSLEYLVVGSAKMPGAKRLLGPGNPLKCIFFVDSEREDRGDLFPGVKSVFKNEISASQAITQSPAFVKGEDTAYILYTSGSTGIPKGVVITHKASLAFVKWVCGYLGITRDDHIPAYSPLNFDLSVLEIYAGVKAGATLHIVPQGISAFPVSLADFIENEGITVWYSVPTVFIRLVSQGVLEGRDLTALRKIIFTGEVFPVKYLKLLMRMIPSAGFYNFYGPTETNVCVYYALTSAPEGDDPVPIGAPYAGQEVFILDENGALVKEGEKGELYVGGPTLMEGYWNDPVKTGKVLLKNIFSGGAKKIYKTGDIVSLGKGGYLYYHGRNDLMIKSGGYRVEPGEVEAVLSVHPMIKEAVVLGAADTFIGRKIKAVIVPLPGAALSQEDVKAYCAVKLPRYMVPETVVFADDLPRTRNEKIDRALLERM